MAKRRLSHQQKERIRASQARRRERADNSTEASGAEQTGLLVSRQGKTMIVEDEASELHRCTCRQNIGTPVVGDRVVFQPAEQGDAVIVALHERESLLARPVYDGSEKPVAANLDRIFIVAAVKPELSEALIDRYLVVAEHFGFHPVIVINKTDMLDDEEQLQLKDRIAVYHDIGYEVIYSSAKDEHGLLPLQAALDQHTSIMVGQSGVGKSSLIKALLPDLEIRTGILTEINQGRHTTTTSTLYRLPDGGELIDSPGVRDFAVWNLDRDAVTHGFRELQDSIGLCRFRNCRHEEEPGCAVRGVHEQGKISEQRFQSYLQILDDMESRS